MHESFTLLSIGDALHEPFASSELVFFPKDAHAEVKADPKGPWTAKALPYANVWRYLQRLNTLAFGGWQLGEPQIITLSDRLIVLISVTVAGVTMWGVGEEMLAGTATRVDENAFRGAWAQARFVACAYFGLGLFLYFLGKPRSMAYDPKERRIAASDEDLSAMAEEMLSRARGMNQLVVPPACLVADLAGLHDRYLVEPFPVGQVHFLGFDARETESGSVATAAPFVRVWDLVRRLNATAYGRWQVLAPRVTVADNKALVTLTLDLLGTLFVGTGEAFFIKTVKGEDVVNDHAVEDAWAEAMKGACNTADLGLYLRFLPQLQFPYRTKWRSFDDEPGIATTLYQLAGLPVPEGARGVMPVTPVGEEAFANRAGVGSADNPDGKAAGTQLTSLRNLYRNLQRDEPGDLDTLTWAQAKERIAELTAQLSQRRKSAAA